MPRSAESRYWLRLSHAYGLAVGLVLSYFLVGIPIQVYDCFSDMVSLARPMTDLVRDTLWQSSYLRPGRYVQAKIVYELADGEFYYPFRLVHAAHVVALIALFVRMVQPSTATAAVALPLALSVLIGSHTFAWTLREAFPINHYLTMVVACVAAANLVFARHRWWTDALAVALFAAAALTIESGLLVWVILTGGYLLGLRGVSGRGVAAATGLLAVYLVLRFVVLDVGAPSLLDREAGFISRRYTGEELQAMFGGNPLPFYAYNVGASILNLLIAEPREGVFRLPDALRRGEVAPPLLIGMFASAVATALVAGYVWRRRDAWRARAFDRGDQIVALFLMVLLANAAMGYAYTKDVIMAPAGVFFAAAVFVACRNVGESLASRRAPAAAVALLALLSSAWAIRAIGIHAALAATSLEVREQWAYVDDWLVRVRPHGLTADVLRLKRQLQDDAILRHPAKPPLRSEWTRLFEVD